MRRPQIYDLRFTIYALAAVFAGWLVLAAVSTSGQSPASPPATGTNLPPRSEIPGNATNQLSSAKQVAREARIRDACINGRRRICGPVVQITPDGLVVDSGYNSLLRPELSRSWVARSNVSATRPPQLIEENTPGSVCVGLVFITDIPKKPVVQAYDYVILEGYPDGQYTYAPLGNIRKEVRRFTTDLEKAVKVNLQAETNKVPATVK